MECISEPIQMFFAVYFRLQMWSFSAFSLVVPEIRSLSAFQHYWALSSTKAGVQGHSNYRHIFIPRELSLPAHHKEMLREYKSQTSLSSQIAREHVLRFSHQQKVAGERLIGEKHVQYDHQLISTGSSSFEEN